MLAVGLGVILGGGAVGCSADTDETEHIDQTDEPAAGDTMQTRFVESDMDAISHGELPDIVRAELFRRGCVDFTILLSTTMAFANGNGDSWDETPLRELLEPKCAAVGPDLLSTFAGSPQAKIWMAWGLGCGIGLAPILFVENENKGTPISASDASDTALTKCAEAGKDYGNTVVVEVLNQFVNEGTISRTDLRKIEVRSDNDPNDSVRRTADGESRRWRTYCQELPGQYVDECLRSLESGFQEMAALVFPAEEIREEIRFNRSLNFCDPKYVDGYMAGNVAEHVADPHDSDSVVNAPGSFFSCVALSYGQRTAHYKNTGDEI